jgi:hypothetical protein
MTSPIQETRWIVLTGDGSHSTLGRYREPDEADLVRAAEALERTGQPAWVAFLEGRYHGKSEPKVRELRRLTGREGDLSSAVKAFLDKRQTANR